MRTISGRRMKRSAEENWIDALQGSAKAYRALGCYYLGNAYGISGTKKRKIKRKLAYLCLEHAAEIGDAKAFYLLHHNFSKGKKVIDDASYRQIVNEYLVTRDGRKKKKLQYYLKQGTKEQRAECRKQIKSISGKVPAYKPEQDASPPVSKKKRETDTATALQ